MLKLISGTQSCLPSTPVLKITPTEPFVAPTTSSNINSSAHNLTPTTPTASSLSTEPRSSASTPSRSSRASSYKERRALNLPAPGGIDRNSFANLSLRCLSPTGTRSKAFPISSGTEFEIATSPLLSPQNGHAGLIITPSNSPKRPEVSRDQGNMSNKDHHPESGVDPVDFSRQCATSSQDADLSSSDDDDDAPTSLGTLEFTLYYDDAQQILTTTISKASKLKAMDQNGFSDPYVKVHLLPGAGKSTQLRTKTLTKNLNPEWNESLKYYGITEDEMLTKVLRLTVLDEDTFGHDFLGETRFELKKLKYNQERKFNVYLEKQMAVGRSECATDKRGKICISLAYAGNKSQLLVGIIRCSELIGMDPNGYSDPYVTVTLLPDKKRKHKTGVKKRTCNPVYDTEFPFPCTVEDLFQSKTLDIRVYDKDVGKHDDYIGGVSLNSEARGERLRHWLDCIKNPNKKFTRWHRLTTEQT